MSYWICQLAGWGLYALAKVIGAVQVDGAPWLAATATLVLLNAAAVALTHALRSYMRRHRWSELRTGKLAWRIVVAGILLGIPLSVATSFSPVAGMDLPPGWVAEVPSLTPIFALSVNLLNWGFAVMIWLIIYFTTLAVRRHQAAALRESEMARALQHAQLRLLKSQLNPHFLFNALNTVRSLIAEDSAKAQRAVTRLANTLRYTLGAGHHELVSFERELEMVSDFLELEKLRFEARLTVEQEVAVATDGTHIPSMLLQTVVENAIKHGIAELPAGGTLRIRADLSDGVLVLQVENPRPLTTPRPTSEGTGLRNAEERLRLLFNSRASLELDLSKAGWATTRIRIPQHS